MSRARQASRTAARRARKATREDRRSQRPAPQWLSPGGASGQVPGGGAGPVSTGPVRPMRPELTNAESVAQTLSPLSRTRIRFMEPSTAAARPRLAALFTGCLTLLLIAAFFAPALPT